LHSPKSVKRVILAVINDLVTDQRVHRMATYLHNKGCQVLVIGRFHPQTPIEALARSYNTFRFRMFFHKGKLFYLEFNLRLLFKLLMTRADTLVANDLDTLFPNYLVAYLLGRRLIYDTHELFTEVPELIHRPLTQSLWKRLERWIFPKLKHVMTVSNGIADYYTQLYQVPVAVIRNVPERYSLIQQAEKLQENPILIYQGALNIGRGIELLIDSMAFLPECQLWIIGAGDIETALKSRVAASNLSERVQFKGRIAAENLRLLTAQASIGLSLEEDLGLNYRYAAPNKLFDYIQAHIPVIVSNLPEMARIITDYQVGQVLQERQPELLAQLIRSILENGELYQQYKNNCQKAAQQLNWEIESQKLDSIYGL
jgi:glycosyltransferase involved in cell wall biosynthesis